MGENPDRERLKSLEDRIARARGTAEPPPAAEKHFSQANVAWRMVIELVTGLAIGFGIGYGLDRWLGTAPFLMVVFTLLGFAAGVKTMLRSAHEIEAQAARRAADEGE